MYPIDRFPSGLPRTAMTWVPPRREDHRDDSDDGDSISDSDEDPDVGNNDDEEKNVEAMTVLGLPSAHNNPYRRSDAAQQRQMDEQDRRDLELDSQRAWDEVDRLRKWKDRLRRENKGLRGDTMALKREVKELKAKEMAARVEVKRLKERYESVWRDKVTLEEQLSGPASLPLEMLLNIAGFVAGENNYGTLLNLSLVSKLIMEEMKPVLFETVMLNDVRGLMHEPGTGRPLDAYQFTKFVYAGENVSASNLRKYFPNVRAIFILTPGTTRDVDSETDNEAYPPFVAELTLLHPVRLETLASLLKSPVEWVQGRSKTYHPIQGITPVTLEAQGALISSGPDDFHFRNLVKDCMYRTADLTRPERFPESLPQLHKLVPISPKGHGGRARHDWSPYPCVTIRASSEFELDAWLANLASFLRRQPNMYVEINIAVVMNRTQYQARLLTAAAAYGSLWQEIQHDIKTMEESPCSPFFVMDYSPPATAYFRGTHDDPIEHFMLAGQLQRTTTSDSFVVNIAEIDEVTGRESTLLDQPFVIEGARA